MSVFCRGFVCCTQILGLRKAAKSCRTPSRHPARTVLVLLHYVMDFIYRGVIRPLFLQTTSAQSGTNKVSAATLFHNLAESQTDR